MMVVISRSVRLADRQSFAAFQLPGYSDLRYLKLDCLHFSIKAMPGNKLDDSPPEREINSALESVTYVISSIDNNLDHYLISTLPRLLSNGKIYRLLYNRFGRK